MEMSSLIVVSFATAMTNDEISITASHYALFTFLFTLFNGSVGCVPSQNKHVNHHPREIHLSKSESNASELTPSCDITYFFAGKFSQKSASENATP